MSIEIGKNAPAFSLKDQNDKTVRLAELKGRWVVLYFYPNDDTPGCTVEACDFTSGIKAFEKMNAKVFGCSPNSAESHRKFIEKFNLKVDLLVDEDHAVMEKYEAWGPKVLYGKESIGVIRSTVVLDPAGKIAAHWKKVKAEGHAESVRAKLAELQAPAR